MSHIRKCATLAVIGLLVLTILPNSTAYADCGCSTALQASRKKLSIKSRESFDLSYRNLACTDEFEQKHKTYEEWNRMSLITEAILFDSEYSLKTSDWRNWRKTACSDAQKTASTSSAFEKLLIQLPDDALSQFNKCIEICTGAFGLRCWTDQ